MGNLKYSIEFLGLYDNVTGEPQSDSKTRHIKWMTDNCKGKWRYDSSDVKLPPLTKKSDDWPTFFTMQFSFSRKTDYESFRKMFS